MKNLIYIISLITFTLFFNGCIILRNGIYNDLLNEKEWNKDVYDRSEDKIYALEFGVGGSDDVYKYTSDSLHTRFKYEFKISTPKCPLIKLNSFSFTRKIDKDTIPFKLYFKYYFKYNNYDKIPMDSLLFLKDSIPYAPQKEYRGIVFPIDNLPFLVDKILIGKKGAPTIIAECSESYYNTNEIYISYDIEIGNEHIIRKNIKYSRQRVYDLRPKFW